MALERPRRFCICARMRACTCSCACACARACVRACARARVLNLHRTDISGLKNGIIFATKNAHRFGFNLVPRLVQVISIASQSKFVPARVGSAMRRCALAVAHRGGSSNNLTIALCAPPRRGRSCARSAPLLDAPSYEHC